MPLTPPSTSWHLVIRRLSEQGRGARIYSEQPRAKPCRSIARKGPLRANFWWCAEETRRSPARPAVATAHGRAQRARLTAAIATCRRIGARGAGLEGRGGARAGAALVLKVAQRAYGRLRLLQLSYALNRARPECVLTCHARREPARRPAGVAAGASAGRPTVDGGLDAAAVSGKSGGPAWR
jgi:hypothetical protein